MKTILNYINFINESYNDTDYISNRHREHDEDIKKLNPRVGQFINIKSEYGFIYHQIQKVYSPDDWYGSVYYYDRIDNNSDKSKIESTNFYNIRKIVDKIPDDADFVSCKEGTFSNRRSNLDKLPLKYRD